MEFRLLDANEQPLYSRENLNDTSGREIVFSGPNGFAQCRHAARSRLNKKKGATQNYGPYQRGADGALKVYGGIPSNHYCGDMYIVASEPLDSGQSKWYLRGDGGFYPVDPATNREISPEDQLALAAAQ